MTTEQPKGTAAQDRVDAKTRVLRQQAEAMHRERAVQTPEQLAALSPEATQRLLHELQVHQIELQMQNEELRSAYAELDVIRANYFDLYDLAPVGYCTVNERGLILQANLTAATLFGLVRGELVRRHLSQLICKQDQDLYYLHRKQLLASEGLRSFELRIVRPDGALAWVNFEARAAIDATGEQVLRIALSDITERKQVQEALRIDAVAFDSQQGMFVTDNQSVILRVNKAFIEITGYSAADAVGKTPRLFQSGRHDKVFYTALWQQLASSGHWSGEILNRRKSGEVFPQWMNISAVIGEGAAVSHYVASFTDITQRKAAEEQIKNLAFYDPLTQLPNRRLLMDRLEQAIATSARNNRKGALLFVDLDNFKTLNDTLGHASGDLLLEQVAKRLGSCIRECDTVARLGGDEFVVMLVDLNERPLDAAAQAEVVAKKVLAVLNQGYELASYLHHSSASVGVTLFGGEQESLDEPLKRADLAMYQAKAEGRNTLRFFDPHMQAVATGRAALESGIREALASQQFLLFYQPQVTGEGQITGAEALVRWQHPQSGMMSPAVFIPLAEETGLILQLGQWVLETACRQLARWAQVSELAPLTIAVNVSARQFHQPDFVDQVLAVLSRTGANPRRLKLELTEGILVANVEDVIVKMQALKSCGVGFSLDDFGTGYSSLSYLKRLPLDQLKIDQGFVRDILIDANDAAIAKMVVALADSLGLAVIAEGVETEAQRQFLAGQGCHSYQGYLFSRPLPIDGFEQLTRAFPLLGA